MNFYPQSFAVRLVFCVVTALVAWIGLGYLMHTFVWHDGFEFSVIRHVIVPVACGVGAAVTWRPRQ